MSKKIKIAFLALIIAVGAATAQVRPAKAFLFAGVPNSINWQDFFTDLAKGVAADVLKSITNSFVTNNVNRLTAKYGITQLLPYVNNVANQVYLSQQLKQQGTTPSQNYIIRSLANDSLGLSNTHAPLDPLYVQAATQSYDILNLNKTTTGSSDFYTFLAKAGHLGSTPNGQQLAHQDLATTYLAQAKGTAKLDVSQSASSKSSYTCDNPFNAGKGGTATVSPSLLSVCATQNPGKTTANAIDHEINSAFTIENAPPQDHVGLLREALSKTLSNIFLQKLLAPASGNILQ